MCCAETISEGEDIAESFWQMHMGNACVCMHMFIYIQFKINSINDIWKNFI